MFREATSLVAFRNTCGFWVNVSRLDAGTVRLRFGSRGSATCRRGVRGRTCRFLLPCRYSRFIGGHRVLPGVFVPFVVGFQVVGLMVVGPGYTGGFEVLDAVDDPSAALVERFYFPVDFEFSVV